jgi:hypothetical protein
MLGVAIRFGDPAMRALWIGLGALLAMTAPACANGISTLAGHITTFAPTDMGGAGVLNINRGQQFAIACDGIRSRSTDVRVVMSLDNPEPGELPTGYSAVLATNQTVARHAVHVRVPDVPDLANHTVSVKVYVTDAKGTKACDAGRVHIV